MTRRIRRSIVTASVVAFSALVAVSATGAAAILAGHYHP